MSDDRLAKAQRFFPRSFIEVVPETGCWEPAVHKYGVAGDMICRIKHPLMPYRPQNQHIVRSCKNLDCLHPDHLSIDLEGTFKLVDKICEGRIEISMRGACWHYLGKDELGSFGRKLHGITVYVAIYRIFISEKADAPMYRRCSCPICVNPTHFI